MPASPGVKSRNITPDPTFGLPGGLTFHEFMNVMQHGQDQQKPGRLLQGMPWPVFGKKTDYELRAIYEYLRACHLGATTIEATGCGQAVH